MKKIKNPYYQNTLFVSFNKQKKANTINVLFLINLFYQIHLCELDSTS